MLKALSFLQKNLEWSIPISMILGLGAGYLFDAGPLKRLIIPVMVVRLPGEGEGGTRKEEPPATGTLSAVS